VDGYSRMVLWLEPVTDKRAATVWPHFAAVAAERGLPDLLSTDAGGENIYMAFACWLYWSGQDDLVDLVPHKVVQSIHNTRVERLWGDVNHRINRVIRLFGFFLEGAVGFDPSDNVQLGAFHRLMLPTMRLMVGLTLVPFSPQAQPCGPRNLC
jgi:hypothetical protein